MSDEVLSVLLLKRELVVELVLVAQGDELLLDALADGHTLVLALLPGVPPFSPAV
jgi:hypothetical protein